MPAERAPMRKVREVLRLRHALGLSERQIAVTVGVSRSTVGDYLRRAAVIGITWPVPEGLDDAKLERRLFTLPTFEQTPTKPLPDWTHVHRELKRRGVTLPLLWEEYRAAHADGYGYSRFCDLYRAWRGTISAAMRQTHGPAEKLFVDFAGDTVPIFDIVIGMERRAHIFVAVLGASNYTYAEARWSEGLAGWIGAHVNAFTAPDFRLSQTIAFGTPPIHRDPTDTSAQAAR
jgi:transposase